MRPRWPISLGNALVAPASRQWPASRLSFALGGYLLAVTQGASILLSTLTDLSYGQALVVGWLSYTMFTMYSGSRGVILTDTIMFLLFTVASLCAIVYLVHDFDGVPAIIEGLVAIDEKKELMSWHGIVGPGTVFPTPTDYLILGNRHRYQLAARLHSQPVAIQSPSDGKEQSTWCFGRQRSPA
ncbi:MAG: hypothetical protein CM15mP74_24210 [Halieaceae bacterium]|nr:MAG: hypothetical protein CM15mP74_24210 [Halieaceae bacterium]